ncbi:hypothetical protein B0T10DRAFT_455328 [Thelonectria olida]|uniref:FAD/NAD(P)-binding domain-containing protein n=1 Tax=Thelonectria olida TaxID=1576542 RepID=A0A9P8WEI8_9HYPO|nr:hypothetical protein B0T10DRAFT_455328 [Thelonectria olida]
MEIEQHRIVVIGSGFAGTWSALAARRLIASHSRDKTTAANIEVVIVSPEAQLVIRPRLYQADPASMAVPLDGLFSTNAIRHIQATVKTIRASKHELELIDSTGNETTLSYHRLVLAAGSRLARPKLDGSNEHVFNVDQIEDSVKLEEHLKKLPSLPDTQARGTVVVCGAGFTGLEVATELPSRLRSSLGKDSQVRVILVGREKEVGATLGPGPRPVIAKALADLGVETRLGTTVTSVDAGGASLDNGERIEALTTIWTAGVRASPLAEQLPGETDSFGRLYVDEHLRLPSMRDVFVTGDSACAVADNAGNHALMSCQHALTLGRVSGHNAAADLLDLPTKPYSQPMYLTCLDLGPQGAVLTCGWDRKVVLSGWLAKMAKVFINEWLIYPPKAESRMALPQANPANFVSAPAVLGQRVVRTILWMLAYVRSLFI